MNIKNLGIGLWEIDVPRGIRFISEWSEYNFAHFSPRCIIDKQIPGCGYTEWCICNMYNVILASPRKTLLENKAEQHPGEVFLVRNELDRDLGIDKDTSRLISETAAQKELSIEQLGFSTPDIYNKIRNEFLEYRISRGNNPIKILVTYDSYYLVKTILQDIGIFDQFYTVIDEFQAILSDSRFKSNTELEFMSVLKDVNYLQFISATPMLDKYLRMLPDFNGLDIYKLNWKNEDPSRVTRPNLRILTMMSIGEVLPKIIQQYKDGNFERITVQGKEIISDEAVFYVNSVNHIINIIKKCELKSEQVNILCSNTPENAKRIRTKLGKEFSIGKVPLKGVKPKMFTFCTRTVYLGADFYSTCAKSYIFSDSNSDCLAVDISQDLPQILGRQRLIENPWKNSATFYYKSTCDWRKKSKEDFDKIIKSKLEKTDDLLRGYKNSLSTGDQKAAETLADVYQARTKTTVYKEDYVSVNTKSDQKLPVLNQYVYVSDIRSFDIQQIDYADRFSVFREIEDKIYNNNLGLVSDMIKGYFSLNNNISARLKYICEIDPNFTETFLGQLTNDDYAKSYYLQLGPDRCKALGYNVSKIRKELGIVKFDKDKLEQEISSIFRVGSRILRSDAKNILSQIYKKIGYSALAKASDLNAWFELKDVSIIDPVTKKKSGGFELIKKK